MKNVLLLLIRAVLAYGFFETASEKWKDIASVGDWFATLHIPFPHFNAYLSAGTEALGVLLLVLGLATRWISIPLMFVLLVAIGTVHWKNGFDAGNNGFEIPLYYLLLLGVLLAYGGGTLSADNLIGRLRTRLRFPVRPGKSLPA